MVSHLEQHWFSRINSASILSVPLLVILAFGTHLAHLQVERKLAGTFTANESTVGELPSVDTVRKCSLGYDALAADCFWLALIQYVGDGAARSGDHYQAAHRFLRLIIGLNPSITEAYWFSAFVVGADEGRPDIADRLIQHGIATNPNSYYPAFIAGINQYLYAHNLKAAAAYYRLAATYPGAPAWLSRQANILEQQIPAIIKEINTWSNIYNSSETGPIKEGARQKLIGLWSKVLQDSPSEQIKNRAKAELKNLIGH